MECPICGKKVKLVETDKGSKIMVDKWHTPVWVTDSLGRKSVYRLVNANLGHNNTCKGKAGNRHSPDKMIMNIEELV